jgi:hypothetical protein
VTQADLPKRDPSREANGAAQREPNAAEVQDFGGTAGPALDAKDADDSKEARKERVLHTRVPAVLERELKRFADNLRIPVSNLVRTILEDALLVADAATGNVEERLRRAAQHLEKEREKIRKHLEHDPLEGIVAFQEVMLAVPAACAKCGATLARGARAHLGIGDGPGERTFVCDDCRPRG